MQFLPKFITLLSLGSSLASAFDIDSKQNVAVYWGQNSKAELTSQEPLATYCQSSDADIFIVSFLVGFPDLQLNLANSCNGFFPGRKLLHCPRTAEDIKTCQKLGKKVFISLGGDGGIYGFKDDAEAEAFAQTLWDTFGEGTGQARRPFNDAVVDGFDFDIENNNKVGYVALSRKLRELFKQGTKQYYISTAPQCPYPDYNMGDMIEQTDVDFAFIQFYNNYCNLEGSAFNFKDWVYHARDAIKNKNIKLYVGLPGAQSAANSGYVSDLSKVKSAINEISSYSNFGGIMLWDSSQAFSNKIDGESYIHHMKAILKGAEFTPFTPNTLTTKLDSEKPTAI